MEKKTGNKTPFVVTANPFYPFPGLVSESSAPTPGLVSESSETDPGLGTSLGAAPGTSLGAAPAPAVAAKGKPGRKGKGKAAPDIFLSDAAALDKARLGADPDDEEMQPTENV